MEFSSPFRRVAFTLGSGIAALADSKTRIVLFSLAIGGCLAGFEFIIHEIIMTSDMPELAHAAVDAGFVGCGSALFTVAWLSALRERRLRVREDMRKVGELNHHVRNALEIIMMSQHGTDSERARAILESVNRIDRVLTELFPTPGHARKRRRDTS